MAQGFDLSGKCISNNENAAVCVNAKDNQFNGSIELNRKIQYLANKITVLNMNNEELETTYQNLVKEHAHRCNEYERLAEDNGKLGETYENLMGENSRLLDDLKKVKQQCNTYKLQYDTLSNSASWKLTAPIRYFLDKIKGK